MKRVIGHQMRRVIGIVTENPGCTKMFVAERISPHPCPSRNWSLGYAPVNRALKAGLIRAERRSNAYALFPSTGRHEPEAK